MGNQDDDSKSTEDQDTTHEDDDEGSGSKPKTVNAEKYNRLLERYNELDSQYKETSSKLDELSKSKSGDVDDIRKQLEELQASSKKDLEDANARFEASEKNHAIEAALLKAGCKDIVAARAHIKDDDVKFADGKLEGIDIDALKKDRGYLFGASAPAGSAGGGNPEGGTESSTVDKIADVFGIKKKEG